MKTSSYFTTYDDWRQALTVQCGIELTATYAQERVLALQNVQDRTTKEFTAHYGEAYLRQVIAWFERAAREA